MNDERADWEVSFSIWLQNAHSYLRYLDLPPNLQHVYMQAFGISGGLTEWARKHTEKALARANVLVEENGPLTFVPSAVRLCADDLRARGLNGSALSAGGFRTDDAIDTEEAAADIFDAELSERARAYIMAYDAWWASLSRQPLNEGKGPDHRALCRVAREAWRAFDWALNERGIVTADRYALARELTAGIRGE